MPECPEHPGQEAIYQCDRCGRDFCEQCVAEQGDDTMICTDCGLLFDDLLELA